ncbi:Plasmid partitioning protein parB [Thiomonas arsenitoxydans]|uniref:Plasmid partitioning protein parB n=1 Tax=Thiomonas arsenitoxydans (strain DSM 22701 / CIP 110005 / 3As) TaxID=426114 RepID=D6CVR1_THIA3|nr:ParB/RepB/Spo0J family partition protein [Thiomonas arsenitoxydans]CAZ90400.1 plasmid partitioning protein parB [Thiomonas arsenitoxydans]CQR32794.1 Plasmid partitioning protein parB [Thiomonas arsenitoxydans]CQR45748.1 Plasmid partitioning protein parB [Thiomonas sp. CB3]
MAKSLFGGRKADALIPASNPASFAAMFDPNADQWSLLDLDDIEIRAQSRQEFDAESIAELARSIADIGQAVPVIVRRAEAGAALPYVLVAGERRCRALRELGREQVRAVIRTISDTDAAAIQAAENIHRENLSQMDQARMVAQMAETLGSAEAAARHFGKSPGWVSQQMMLLNLPPVAQTVVDDNLSSDLAVIAAVSTVERQSGATAAAEVVRQLKAAPKGKAREVARSAARTAKDAKGREGARAALVKPAGVDTSAGRAGAGDESGEVDPVMVLHVYLLRIERDRSREGVNAWLRSLPEGRADAISAHLRAYYAQGEHCCLKPAETLVKFVRDGVFSGWGKQGAAMVAWVNGLAGRPFDVIDILLSAGDEQ